MRKFDFILVVLCLHSTFAVSNEFLQASVLINFSPDGHIASNICKSIANESGEVLILASKFSNKNLGKCLNNIQKSGRRVLLILDSSFIANNQRKLLELEKLGLCIYADSNHNTAHNKVVIAGHDFVFSGSYNFTDDSEYLNAENGIFIRSSEINRIYRAEFFKHLNHSVFVKFKTNSFDQCTLLQT